MNAVQDTQTRGRATTTGALALPDQDEARPSNDPVQLVECTATASSPAARRRPSSVIEE